MRHDYVNRKIRSSGSKVPHWVIMFTLVVTILFVVGLLFLSWHSVDPQPSGQQLLVPKPQPLPKTPALPKPQQSQKAFDFYTLLPDIQVKAPKVEAYKSTPKDASQKLNILLQAGSFKRLADANRLRAQLILLNLPSVVTQKATSASGSTWYRVRLGPFANRSTLNKAEDIMAQQNIESIRIKIALGH
jgi:cell division protein FtsN